MTKQNTLVFIPTYNESGNVERLFQEITKLKIKADVLFLDDNSPDGTGKIIDRLVERHSHVHVIHRSQKSGIGSAHQEGIAWAYDQGYEYLITMDCDFSHSPKYLLEFLKWAPSYDVVVGSRHMQNDSLQGWSYLRKILTYSGYFMTKTVLGMSYDATGAYRLYNLKKLPREIFKLITAKGYSFFFESLYILFLNDVSVKEFPVHLSARTIGKSKMKFRDMVQSLRQLVRTFFKIRLHQDQYIYCEPFVPQVACLVGSHVPYTSTSQLAPAQVEADWNQYWAKKNRSSSFVYDLIARFYRTFIIKPALNFFLKKNFASKAKVLHAGCGSGQVDFDLAKYLKITAMDISVEALNIYKRVNRNKAVLVHGDIFDMPFEASSFDGIYNLGVMEHFSEDEIQKILSEFKRVLRPNGRIVLFWPPEFGISVRFLKGVHFILNKILKKNIKLHPDEITRVQSKAHVKKIIDQAGFEFVDYYFGPKDMFTQAVVTARKM